MRKPSTKTAIVYLQDHTWIMREKKRLFRETKQPLTVPAFLHDFVFIPRQNGHPPPDEVIEWYSVPEGPCNHLNGTWTHLTGGSLEQAMGFGWMAAVHPEDLARIQPVMDAAMPLKKPYTYEFRLRLANGEYRWMRCQGVPHYAAD